MIYRCSLVGLPYPNFVVDVSTRKLLGAFGSAIFGLLPGSLRLFYSVCDRGLNLIIMDVGVSKNRVNMELKK